MENQAINGFLDAINAHDLDAMAGALAPDFLFEDAAGPGQASQEALVEEFKLVFAGMPDLLVRPVGLRQDGERSIVEFKGIGTHRGEFLGVAPTGTTAIVSGVFNLTTGRERITRLRLTIDFGGLRRQLLLARGRT
jgi:steroid delta-isomerase-like uncharacterized protein